MTRPFWTSDRTAVRPDRREQLERMLIRLAPLRRLHEARANGCLLVGTEELEDGTPWWPADEEHREAVRQEARCRRLVGRLVDRLGLRDEEGEEGAPAAA